MWAKAKFYATDVRARLGNVALPLKFGFVATTLWILSLAVYLRSGSRWAELWSLPLNNMGDVLAGAVAPLAFLWVVIAVLLQTTELGLQREELKQNVQALQQQAAETRSLVEQNKLSVDVANKALRQQQLREQEARLHQVIDGLRFKITNLAKHSLVQVGPNRTEPLGSQKHLREQSELGGSRDAVFPAALNRIVEWLIYVSDAQRRDPSLILAPSPTLKEEVEMLRTEVQRILAVLATEPELETVRVRVYAIELEAYPDALDDLLSVLKG